MISISSFLIALQDNKLNRWRESCINKKKPSKAKYFGTKFDLRKRTFCKQNRNDEFINKNITIKPRSSSDLKKQIAIRNKIPHRHESDYYFERVKRRMLFRNAVGSFLHTYHLEQSSII